MKNKKKSLKISPKNGLYLLLVIIFIIGAYFLWAYFTSFESTDDAFIDGHIVRISPKVSGVIEKLYVEDNQHVKKGDLLVQIDSRDYNVRYEQAKAAYKSALYKQKAAVAQKDATQTDMSLAQDDYKRYQVLYQKGAVSQQELDKSKSRYESSRATHIGAVENVLSSSKNKVADADLKRLEAAMNQAGLELTYTKIYANQDGKITNRSAEEGAFIGIGAPLFSIVPDKRWVIANFKETQLQHMKPGQKAIIKVDAFPSISFNAKIDSIQASTGAKTSLFPPENAVGSYVKVVQRVPVKIVFTDQKYENYNIEPGMSVIPKVYLK